MSSRQQLTRHQAKPPSNERMRVLILGSSGFIGSRVASQLSRTNAEVINFDIAAPRSVVSNAESIRGNVFDLGALKEVLQNHEFNSIIDLVGLPLIDECERNPEKSRALNVNSLRNLIMAIGRESNATIVFASSAAVYGNDSAKPVQEDYQIAPVAVYGKHKMEAEEALLDAYEQSALKYVILRLFNVYGRIPPSGNDFLSILVGNSIKGKPTLLKGRNKFRDFIWIDDVANAFCSVIANNISNKVINVGTGQRTTLGEVADITSALIPGARVEVKLADDDSTGLVADTSRMKSLLGLTPRPAREGITSYVETAINEAKGMIGSRAA
jgi:UDP-glucose 4-epimerase